VTIDELRRRVVLAALGLQGRPYIYGGQLYRGNPGTDCSGLIADAFYLAGAEKLGRILGDRWRAVTYFERCPTIQLEDGEHPGPGDAWIYGAPVSHIAFHVGRVYLPPFGGSEPLLLNASGGGPDVTTEAIASARRARVVLLPVDSYHQRRKPAGAISLLALYEDALKEFRP